MVDAGGGRVRPLHDHAGQHRRERRAALDPALAAPQGFGARMGRRRLRADLRRVHAHRRQARRPLRAAADVRRRPGDLHPLVARLRPRGQRDRADRGARRPGPRRCADEPGDAVDHHRHLPAAAAWDRDRHLGRRLGARARDRPARRRPDHPAHQLELDLLHQRADRRDRNRRGVRVHRRVARHLGRAAARRRRPRHLGPRPVRAHLRADRGEQLRLDVAADPGRVRGGGRRARRVRAARGAPAAADARPVALPESHLRRGEHGDAARRARDVRRLLLRLALHAAGARLLADSRPARASCR